MSALPLGQIGSVTADVSSKNPSLEGSGSFIYVDLSAVDNKLKSIVGPREMLRSDAPSRARQLIKTGDIVVSTVRPNLNAVAVVQPELDGATASTGFCVLRPDPQALSSAYLFHWVQTKQFVDAMTALASGQSYPAISDRIVKNSKMPLPPLTEQQKIAAILDQADALRTKRRQAAVKVASLVQALFIQDFGDPSLNPKGWKTAKLSDVVTAITDGPHVSPTYAENGIPFLSARHILPGSIRWDDMKYLAVQDAEAQWRKCRPQKGDVLYTKGGTTGVAAAVTFDREIAVWVHVALLKTNRETAEPLWLEAMLNTAYCYAQSQKFTHGIANRDLGLKRMANIEIYLPPLTIQRSFVEKRQRVDALKTLSTKADINTLFASLQHRAFRGEL